MTVTDVLVDEIADGGELGEDAVGLCSERGRVERRGCVSEEKDGDDEWSEARGGASTYSYLPVSVLLAAAPRVPAPVPPPTFPSNYVKFFSTNLRFNSRPPPYLSTPVLLLRMKSFSSFLIAYHCT